MVQRTALHKYFYLTVAKRALLKHIIKVTKSFLQKLKEMLENATFSSIFHVQKEACASFILLFPNF